MLSGHLGSICQKTSQIVAEKFGKNHKEVLRDIKNLECTQMFRESNFALSSYKSKQNKTMLMYHITRDGLMFLVMVYPARKLPWDGCGANELQG